MEDWSLQAIVGGLTRTTSDMDVNRIDDFQIQHPFCEDGPHIFHGELEELYKPFYPAPTAENRSLVVLEFQEEKSTNNNGSSVRDDKDGGISAAAANSSAPKYKRSAVHRKNQQKREVIQVTANGLDAADMWAWRKYGQKPIKGSPYPRSYYRCSSSKGCLARKQVEQNCAEPGTYIITYTAEHSHSQPTRRNSLAGTVRQKFPSTKNPSIKQEIKSEGSSSNSPKHIHQSMDYSPRDMVVPFDEIKEEEIHFMTNDDYNVGYGCDDFATRDFVLNEDFFSGLEEFDEFMSESRHHPTGTQQFPVRSCS